MKLIHVHSESKENLNTFPCNNLISKVLSAAAFYIKTFICDVLRPALKPRNEKLGDGL